MTNQDDENVLIQSGSFTYSAVKPDDLSETSYTLVSLVTDTSGSVDSFKSQLIQMLSSIVGACKKSPKVDNILLRRVNFNSTINEFHGFKPISLIDTNTYNSLDCGGMTALRDAVYSSIDATLNYSTLLTAQDFKVNGIIFIITDGDDNSSTKQTNDIKFLISECVKNEQITNITTILIGINDSQFKPKLELFQQEVGISQYVSVTDASAGRLATLANFVSQSVSSKSQNIGGPNNTPVSKTLTI